MPQNTIRIVIVILFIAALTCGFYFVHKSQSITSVNLVTPNFNEPAASIPFNPEMTAASAITPHHLAAALMIDKTLQTLSQNNQPQTIILLSPDHFNTALLNDNLKPSFVSLDIDEGEYEGMKVDTVLLNELVKSNDFFLNGYGVFLDHGLTNLAPFIKKYWSQAQIVPILVPANITADQIKNLIQTIFANAANSALILASVDFSHYLPAAAANFHDVKSIRTISNFETANFKDLEADCWQCLYGARYFAQLKNKSCRLLAHNNSIDFLTTGDSNSTTSYATYICDAEDVGIKNNDETILFVGDIMLDRGVEELINKNNLSYPLAKIQDFLRGIDIVFGNLEGPLVKKPTNFGPHALQFAFASNDSQALAAANFSLFSLANNHTLNMGQSGLAQTREILTQAGINFVGDPLKCSKELFYQKDNVIFLAFNNTFNLGCTPADMVNTVKTIKKENLGKLLIVSIHWGNEYQTINSASQQKLGHDLIDAGADVIIGGHPHVVQNIEQYKGKLIFYSLGNFIFDQYFSAQTQEGLAVGLEIHSDKLIYRLFPLQSQLSQPALMPLDKAAEFLAVLAQRSDAGLRDSIKNGIIKTRL